MVAERKNLVQLIVNKHGFYRRETLNYQNLLYSFRYHLNLEINRVNWRDEEQQFAKRIAKYWPT